MSTIRKLTENTLLKSISELRTDSDLLEWYKSKYKNKKCGDF